MPSSSLLRNANPTPERGYYLSFMLQMGLEHCLAIY
jgi:hypothetical protein